jgi:hypothetical protein
LTAPKPGDFLIKIIFHKNRCIRNKGREENGLERAARGRLEGSLACGGLAASRFTEDLF